VYGGCFLFRKRLLPSESKDAFAYKFIKKSKYSIKMKKTGRIVKNLNILQDKISKYSCNFC